MSDDVLPLPIPAIMSMWPKSSIFVAPSVLVHVMSGRRRLWLIIIILASAGLAGGLKLMEMFTIPRMDAELAKRRSICVDFIVPYLKEFYQIKNDVRGEASREFALFAQKTHRKNSFKYGTMKSTQILTFS